MSTREHLHTACFERKPLKERERERKGKETIQLHSTVKTSCEFNLTRYTAPAAFKRGYLSVHSSPLPTICRRSLTKERDKLFRRSWGKMWRYNMAQLTDKPPFLSQTGGNWSGAGRRSPPAVLLMQLSSLHSATHGQGWRRKTSSDVLLHCKADRFLNSLVFLMYSVLWM